MPLDLKSDRLRKETERRAARVVATVHPSAKSLKRRARLEKSFQAWAAYYMPDVFSKAFGKVHDKAFSKIQDIIENGGMQAESMSRGCGKSAIGKAAALYCPLTGKRKFVVPLGASIDLAQVYYEFIVHHLTQNPRIHEDYPEVTTFFRALEGSAHKAKYQIFADHKPTGIKLKPKLIVFPNTLKPDGRPYPSAQAIIAIRSIDGRIRGMSYTLLDGREIRPDMVIPDDIQTEEVAGSDVLSEKMERTVVGAVLNLAGPDCQIACYMPCTIQRVNDVSSRFVNRKLHPNFQGTNTPLFIQWPKDHAEKRGLWIEYEQMWREDHDNSRAKAQTLNHFLKAHWDAMHEGAEVSWESRIRTGELSAVQTGMHLFFENGDAFFAEYQGAPIVEGATLYNLTPTLVQSRVDHERPAGMVPDWSRLVVAATDLNPSYAYTWGVGAVGSDQRVGIAAYGFFNEHPLPILNTKTPAEKERAVIEALVIHGRRINALPCRPEAWTVDASGEHFAAVLKFSLMSQRECGIQCIPSTGRAGKNYNPGVKSRTGVMQNGVYECYEPTLRARWICWDADRWKEISQLGWTGTLGSPGSCSLFAGRHNEWAEQSCREQLAGKAEIGGRMVYKWNVAPGKHDSGDVNAMIYMLAGWRGIGTGETAKQPQRQRRRPSGCTVIAM